MPLIIETYEIPFSKNFKTFVFSYFENENELKTLALTFDKNFKKIDQLLIAYDEIAESASSTQSELTQDRIIVMDRDYLSDPTVITKTSYAIKPNGSILKE